MRKFMLIAVSVLLTMFLARDARAQTNTHYDYTYYTTANSYVCAVRAPFGEVHILHTHPVTYHMCQEHHRHFLHNYPAHMLYYTNDIYYTHWDSRISYNIHYLNVRHLTPRRYYSYYSHPQPRITFRWNNRVLPHTSVRVYDYKPPVRRYAPPQRPQRSVVTYGTTRTSTPPQERRTVRSETTTRRRATTSSDNSSRRRSRDGNRERRRR